MNIVKTNKELDKKDIYKMTLSPAIKRMRDCVGSVIPVVNYCMYTDKKNDGTEMNILSIMDNDGVCYATNSPTFNRDFERIIDIMGDDTFEIEIISGTSKAGRDFITCALV